MPNKSKATPQDVQKLSVFLPILKNVALLFVLVILSSGGLMYYGYDALEQRLAGAETTMDAYTAMIETALLSGRERVRRYGDAVWKNCYAPGANSHPDQMLNTLVTLEGESHIGIVDSQGSHFGAGYKISDINKRPYYFAAVNGESGIFHIHMSDTGEPGAFVFVEPLFQGRPDNGGIYYIDPGALDVVYQDAQFLTDVGESYVLDKGNQAISYAGQVQDDFSYATVRSSGLLATPGRKLKPFQLLRNGGIVLSDELPDIIRKSLPWQQSQASSDEILVTANVWFERPLSVNGWKALANIPVLMDAQVIRSYVLLILISAGVILILMVFSILAAASEFSHQRKLVNMLLSDSVTGGKNFLSFRQDAQKLLKKNAHFGKVFVFACLDINRFRVFSEIHGHEAGEALLVRMHRHLSRQLQKDELLARYSIDEYALLLIQSPSDDPLRRVESMMHGLCKLYPGERIRCSAGVYIVNDRSLPVERMYSFAAVARDAARVDASDAPVLFDNAMRDIRIKEQLVEAQMETAIANREFVVYLQPKFSVQEQRLSGAEALVRWNNPQHGLIPPNEFIPVFERSGFIVKLDDYMLESVCAIKRKWIDAGLPHVPISVNISRVNFTNPRIARHIKGIVDRYEIPYREIELELTESAFFDDETTLLRTVQQLRKYGFSISMDDFGSGYSSLNSLKNLPLDVVKLDKEFFEFSDDMERCIMLIHDTIEMAKHLQMQVVAEGIETQEQFEFLRNTGCDLIQGYYFAKPMPLEEFEQLQWSELTVPRKDGNNGKRTS